MRNRNIEKIAILAIVLLVLSMPVTYATKSNSISKVSVSTGDARAHSEAISSDGGAASAISDITVSEGNSAIATSDADASDGGIASATTIVTNKNGDCHARAVGENTDNCVTGDITGIGNVARDTTGIGNVARDTTGIGNVAVTENVAETTTKTELTTTVEPMSIMIGKIPLAMSDTLSGDISIATSEDGSSEPIVISVNVATTDGHDDASVVG